MAVATTPQLTLAADAQYMSATAIVAFSTSTACTTVLRSVPFTTENITYARASRRERRANVLCMHADPKFAGPRARLENPAQGHASVHGRTGGDVPSLLLGRQRRVVRVPVGPVKVHRVWCARVLAVWERHETCAARLCLTFLRPVGVRLSISVDAAVGHVADAQHDLRQLCCHDHHRWPGAVAHDLHRLLCGHNLLVPDLQPRLRESVQHQHVRYLREPCTLCRCASVVLATHPRVPKSIALSRPIQNHHRAVDDARDVPLVLAERRRHLVAAAAARLVPPSHRSVSARAPTPAVLSLMQSYSHPLDPVHVPFPFPLSSATLQTRPQRVCWPSRRTTSRTTARRPWSRPRARRTLEPRRPGSGSRTTQHPAPPLTRVDTPSAAPSFRYTHFALCLDRLRTHDARELTHASAACALVRAGGERSWTCRSRRRDRTGPASPLTRVRHGSTRPSLARASVRA